MLEVKLSLITQLKLQHIYTHSYKIKKINLETKADHTIEYSNVDQNT